MTLELRERVLNLLQQMPHDADLEPLKQLFWRELNYDRANQRLSTRDWLPHVAGVLAEDPTLFATAGGDLGGFKIIYCRLKGPLLISPQRPVISTLIEKEGQHGLYIFSSEDQTHWHLVNLKYDRDAHTRKLLRRITISPYERLRTAAERISLLDVATIKHDLFGVSPLAVQARHDEAFDVEAVTRDFFRDYRSIFENAEESISGIDDQEQRRLFTQKLFNRMMFIVFLERKGWLEFRGEHVEYLRALWEDHTRELHANPPPNFYSDRLKLLFFSGLNTPNDVNLVGINQDGFLQSRIGQMPYLNGGLFEPDADDQNPDIFVPDGAIETAIEDLFYHYNFTITESTPLDIEVAVDPEMLGKIFEELVTGRHETGSYYTPKAVVSFMGREALKGYLYSALKDEAQGAIDRFVDLREPDELTNPEGVLEALRHVTICDPACGSGAYLLGMLQELLELRMNLFRGERRLDDIKAFDRKLQIIQNNLYGVDRDQFAVNIARLRLWLSLIVDFQGPREKVPPLPNLDFKIEAGDSVLGPDPSGGLQPDLIRHGQIETYKQLKSDYLNSHGPDKRTLHQQVVEQRAAIADWVREGGYAEGFDWAVEFAEVFEDQGFHIVITNPPYVRQELIRDIKPALRLVYGRLFVGTADLFVYFYYRALQMLRPGGMLCFISSNKWMRAGYGETLRRILAEQNAVQTIVDFGDLPVFTATAYPCVVLVKKEAPSEDHTLRALNVEDIAAVERIADEVATYAWRQPQASLRTDGWTLVQPEVLTLMDKLRKKGTPLAQYVQGRFYRGIVTGLNEAFVIDESIRTRLIAEDPRSEEIIKPWLRGRDLKRWSVDWAGLYVIFTRRGIKIDDYPAIYAYLAQFKERLTPGIPGGRKPGSYEWYEIQDNIAYYTDFEKPKILYPDISKSVAFSYDRDGLFGGNTMYFIPSEDLYLLAVLNAPPMEFYYRNVSSMLRGDYLRFFTQYVEQLPVPSASTRQRSAIVALVQQMFEAKEQHQSIASLEQKLTQIVYDVYGLEADEIAVIEEAIRDTADSEKIKRAADALRGLAEG